MTSPFRDDDAALRERRKTLSHERDELAASVAALEGEVRALSVARRGARARVARSIVVWSLVLIALSSGAMLGRWRVEVARFVHHQAPVNPKACAP